MLSGTTSGEEKGMAELDDLCLHLFAGDLAEEALELDDVDGHSRLMCVSEVEDVSCDVLSFAVD